MDADSLDEFDSLKQAENLEDAQNFDGSQKTLATAPFILAGATITLLKKCMLALLCRILSRTLAMSAVNHSKTDMG